MGLRPPHAHSDHNPEDFYSYPPPLPDYTPAAILAFFLFFFGYFPGLIYTVFKLVDALQYSNYYKHLYGRRPDGIGCLQCLLVVGLLGPFVVVGVALGGVYLVFPHR